jgi:hypothetical protein
MEDSYDFPCLLSSRIVLRREDELCAILIQIAARPIAATAFDNDHQAASLTRIFLGRMKCGVIFPAHTV